MHQLKIFENPLVKKCRQCDYVSSAPIKDFYKSPNNKDKLSNLCKKCDSTRGKLWKKNNKDRVLKTSTAYRNTKDGFLIENYNSKWSNYRARKKETFDEKILSKYQIYFTKQMFLEMVGEYEKNKGFVCEVTGVPLTHIRYAKEYCTKTNFSMDRLDPDIGYTKQNTIFVTWEFNDRKNAVTPRDCFLIIKKYKERFPEEFKKFMEEFGEVFK
jgi:hypothetical protein